MGPDDWLESRRLGDLSMFAFFQPAGSFVKPPTDVFLFQIAYPCDGWSTTRQGGQRTAGRTHLPVRLMLPVPGTATTFRLTGPVRGLAFELNVPTVRAFATEMVPTFPGDFGPLHNMVWHDPALSAAGQALWQAAQDHVAPEQADSDATVMRLTEMLLRRAGFTIEPRKRALALSPLVRRRVLDWIDDNLADDCSLGRLAKVAGLSPFHFARAFHRDLGETPHRHVLRRRLLRAEALLHDRRMSLAEIALACGFSSQSRLTEAFSRQFGVTPGRVRRAMHGP